MNVVHSYIAMVLLGVALQYALRRYETRAMLRSVGLAAEDLPGGRAALRAYLLVDALTLWMLVIGAFEAIGVLRLETQWSLWIIIPLVAVGAMLLHALVMRIVLTTSPWIKRVSDALYGAAQKQLETRRAARAARTESAFDASDAPTTKED